MTWKSLPGPDFDYIVLHGVYSWVNAKTRDNIRKFIASRLKKGGIVYLSYDSLLVGRRSHRLGTWS